MEIVAEDFDRIVAGKGLAPNPSEAVIAANKRIAERLLGAENEDMITVLPDGTTVGLPPITFRRDLGDDY